MPPAGNKASLHHAYELAVNAGTSTTNPPSLTTRLDGRAGDRPERHRQARRARRLTPRCRLPPQEAEIANEDRREAYVEAGMAALALDDEETVERLISTVQELAPAMRARPCCARAQRGFEGLLSRSRHGDLDKADEAHGGSDAGAPRDRRPVRTPVNCCSTMPRFCTPPRTQRRFRARLKAEAVTIFERLRATPWLARAQALGAQVVA